MQNQVFKQVMLPFWRLTRGMTVGVQAVITKAQDQVLLVRHGYRTGWHFPGGGVEWRETLLSALAREVEEETGIVVRGQPRLHGVFANFQVSTSDHVALYVVQDWEQRHVPPPSLEIKEQRFFPLAELPADLARGARRRLTEIFEGHPVGQHW
jgi:ADP-ribose pyrophosphatase YjhB (NUDIX family)